MSNNRSGERSGWLFGFLAAFAGVSFGSVFGAGLEIQHRVVAILILLAAVAATVLLSPWRHPEQPYWKLMLPLYSLFFLAVGWSIFVFGGPEAHGLNLWSIPLVLLVLLPLYQIGTRRWIDKER